MLEKESLSQNEKNDNKKATLTTEDLNESIKELYENLAQEIEFLQTKVSDLENEIELLKEKIRHLENKGTIL